MSSVKLTLRPPPNVEFVQGYPGIPPGAPDRPQAAVKGTIEVRVGPQGCKAKWVRIELKKVETLPGGGPTNTFSDFVGPSPVNLWQSSEEYGLLPTQDFPFYIRIPESIPPSIALDKGAGIRYDLVATVCVKGKKGFLRPAKSVIVSTQNTIFLDKHELHSTWPVYSQPESRHLPQDGVHLTVERSRTCYGPGDRVSVNAILKSDSLHTVILRGFEFTLKETTIFRAGAYATGKNRAPVVRETVIGEQKVPVNVTLYGGTTHKAELACVIPQGHTTTSLSAARHIDITYVIHVKALMGTGTHLVMDLPVMISNWPRNVSVELVKRIGTAPSLSLGATSHAPSHTAHNLTHDRKASNGYLNGNVAEPLEFGRPITTSGRPTTATSSQYGGTMPTIASKAQLAGFDDFGYKGSDNFSSSTLPARTNTLPYDEFANRPVEPRLAAGGRRPETANSVTGRFTVTNIGEMDETEASPPATLRTPWLPAEEEKKRLYERATAEVVRVQGAGASPPTTRPISPPIPTPISPKPISPPVQPAVSPRKDTWLTAEQEKTRLYEAAQATATRTQSSAAQSYGTYSPPPAQSTYNRPAYNSYSSGAGASGSQSKSPPQPISSVSSIPVASHGAALYQSAIASMNRNNAELTLPSPPPSRGNSSKAIPAYPSAEEEKAALRRYHEAKNAVNRTQGLQPPPVDPISYDSLYPNTSTPSNSSPTGMPPPFVPSGAQILSEKERLRRAYEAQDAVALEQQQQSPAYTNPPSAFVVPAYTPPSGPPGAGPNGFLPEKELLRMKLEADDAAAMTSPSRTASLRPNPPPSRPSINASIPIAGSSSILSAVEEKAQLKAKYEAEERAAQNGNDSPLPSSFNQMPAANNSPSPSFGHMPIKNGTPPPLMPRPPVEYIQETQEEDARVRDGVDVPGTPAVHPFTRKKSAHEIDLRPFTPFNVGISEPGPPPPLPPKRFDSVG